MYCCKWGCTHVLCCVSLSSFRKNDYLGGGFSVECCMCHVLVGFVLDDLRRRHNGRVMFLVTNFCPPPPSPIILFDDDWNFQWFRYRVFVCVVQFFILFSVTFWWLSRRRGGRNVRSGRIGGSDGSDSSRAAVGRKRVRNAFPDVIERILTHVVNVAGLPALLAHALLVRRLLVGARLAQRQLGQGARQTALNELKIGRKKNNSAQSEWCWICGMICGAPCLCFILWCFVSHNSSRNEINKHKHINL